MIKGVRGRVDHPMIDLNSIKIIFFDIGNVFVSDDPSGCFAYKCLYDRLVAEGMEISVEEFFRLRVEHMIDGGNLWTFVSRYVPEAEFKTWQSAVRAQMYREWSRLSPAISSMDKVPAALAPYYRLGIIANQPGEVEAVLAERNLLQHFEVLAISDKLNLHKPDPAFYQWAVDAAGIQPHEALMVGDRIDNDVRPAKHIGMRTAWLRLGYEGRGWLPETDFELSYAAGSDSIAACEWEPTSPEEEPDIIATTAEELLAALTPTGSNAPS